MIPNRVIYSSFSRRSRAEARRSVRSLHAVTQERDHRGLDKGITVEVVRFQTCLKVEPMRFADDWKWGVNGREDSKMTPSFLLRAKQDMEVPFTKIWNTLRGDQEFDF